MSSRTRSGDETLVFVVSGPGGVGKSTVVSRLVEKFPELWVSKSWTTRDCRPGESPDAYVFVSNEEFEKRIEANGFLEYTNFLGNYYGTPTFETAGGRDVILEIELDGARQVIAKKPDVVLIFLEAPSVDDQLERLRMRGDPEDKVAARVAKATEEAAAGRELNAEILTNFDIEETVDAMWTVIEKARTNRQ